MLVRSRAQLGCLVLAAAVAGGLLCGCEPYRIEYIKRPDFYKQASRGSIPDRTVLDDGTVIVTVYGDEDEGELQRKVNSEDKPFRIREESDKGEVTIRAILPEHVLANTLTCIQNEEYEVLWDQLVSDRTKMAYAGEGMTVDDFASFFRAQRTELARTVNRMVLGLPRQEVIAENLGGGVMQYRFQPHVGRAFKFRKVQMVSEGFGLKLLIIK